MCVQTATGGPNAISHMVNLYDLRGEKTSNNTRQPPNPKIISSEHYHLLTGYNTLLYASPMPSICHNRESSKER